MALRAPTPPATTRAAFTLIELLVVIAIIAILAAILFPVFAQTREKARQATCVSNLKQITLAALMYAQDADETLPPYYYNSLVYWVGGRDNAAQPLDKTRGILYPYVRNGDIQKCPSYTGGSHLGGVGYGYNQRLVFTPSFQQDPAPLAALSAPAETVLFGDAGQKDFPQPGTNETILIGPPAVWYGYPSIEFRHTGFAVFSFVDGHVRAVKQEAFVRDLPPAEQDPARSLKTVGDLLMARR